MRRGMEGVSYRSGEFASQSGTGSSFWYFWQCVCQVLLEIKTNNSIQLVSRGKHDVL